MLTGTKSWVVLKVNWCVVCLCLLNRLVMYTFDNLLFVCDKKFQFCLCMNTWTTTISSKFPYKLWPTANPPTWILILSFFLVAHQCTLFWSAYYISDERLLLFTFFGAKLKQYIEMIQFQDPFWNDGIGIENSWHFTSNLKCDLCNKRILYAQLPI